MNGDLKRFIQTIEKFLIGYEIKKLRTHTEQEVTEVVLEQGNRGVVGYHGFYAVWTFDKNGMFLETGAYE